MKIQWTISLLTILSYASFLNAQDTTKYDTQTIYIQFNKYVKNGQSYPMGFMNKNLRKEMMISPEGSALFEKFRKKTNWLMALDLIMFSSIAIGVSSDNRSIRRGMFYATGGLIPILIPLNRSAHKDFVKAIWVRNRDALK